jgi:hypothetical protein
MADQRGGRGLLARLGVGSSRERGADDRGLLARLGFGGSRTRAADDAAWREAGAPVTVADAAAATELAQEAATPFGYRRPARELLAAFGGEDDDARRRATAALALAGIAADPPLDSAAPTAYVHLRRTAATAGRPATPPASAPPAAPTPPATPDSVAQDGSIPHSSTESRPPQGPPAEPVRGSARRTPATQRMAARFAPQAPVTRDRRIAAGALGLGALAVVMVVAIAFRGAAGDPDTAAEALPPGPAATQTSTAARSTPAPDKPDTHATTPATPPPARPARPRTVRLRVVPTEPAYVCIADGAGATLWEGMLTGPYAVRRKKLVIRVGVATAKITANGRPVRVTTAPGAFELTPAGVRELSGDALVCGGAAAGQPNANGAAATAGNAATG